MGVQVQVLSPAPQHERDEIGIVRQKPLHVPASTRVECVGHFDNSSANPNNPNLLQEVRWGDQSWEEMTHGSIGYLDLSQPVGMSRGATGPCDAARTMK
jgi:hypothetical protein